MRSKERGERWRIGTGCVCVWSVGRDRVGCEEWRKEVKRSGLVIAFEMA